MLKKLKGVQLLTTSSIKLLLNVLHFPTGNSFHFARVVIVMTIHATDWGAAHIVPKCITVLWTQTSGRESVKRWHALSPVAAQLPNARVSLVIWKDVTR